jgi:hypothetical protein
VSPTPQTTHALLVGVEAYAAGSTWNLAGAADRALDVAQWLLARELPPANVHLFLSPMAENAAAVAQRAAQLALDHRPADRVRLEAFLTAELRGLPGEQLCAYWDGHGMLGEGGTRRLFYADATDANRANLDVSRLMRLLRSVGAGALTDQIVIIDACANYSDALGSPANLPPSSLLVPDESQVARQAWLFSTALGERSLNSGAIEKQVTFFPRLMQVLEQETAGWPIDTDRVFPRLWEEFDALRRAGDANQQPVYLNSRAAGGNEHDDAGLPPTIEAREAARALGLGALHLASLAERFAGCPALATRAQRDALLAKLAVPAQLAPVRSDDVLGDLQRILSATARHRGNVDYALDALEDIDSAAAAALRDIARNLQSVGELLPLFAETSISLTAVRRAAAFLDAPDVPAAHSLDHALDVFADHAPEQLLEFAVRALQLLPDDERAGLEAWVKGHQPHASWLTDLSNSLAAERAREQAARPIVLIDGVPQLDDDKPAHVRWWFHARGEWSSVRMTDLHAEGLGATVRRILCELPRAGVEGNPLVQLALPTAAFGAGPHLWPADDGQWGDPILVGEQCPLVLRWHDRVFRDQELGPVAVDWREKMGKIQARLQGDVAPGLLLLDEDNRCAAAQLRELILDDDHDCVVVLIGRARDLEPRDDLLLQALRFGAPYAVWIDDGVGDAAPVRTWAAKLVDDGQLLQLPEKLRRLRARPADYDAQAFAASLNLVWDEPGLSPPQDQTQAPA